MLRGAVLGEGSDLNAIGGKVWLSDECVLVADGGRADLDWLYTDDDPGELGTRMWCWTLDTIEERK
jgi:hypothetical protein